MPVAHFEARFGAPSAPVPVGITRDCLKGEDLSRGQKRPVDVFERRLAEPSEAGAVGTTRDCLKGEDLSRGS